MQSVKNIITYMLINLLLACSYSDIIYKNNIENAGFEKGEIVDTNIADAITKIHNSIDKDTSNKSNPIIPKKIHSLAEVLELVKNKNLTIKTYFNTYRGKIGALEQAKTFPNPEILIQPENIGGTYEGVTKSETAVLLSQLFETGKKRLKRANVAKTEEKLSQLQAEIGIAEILSQAEKSFAQIIATQELIVLGFEQLRLLKEQVEVSNEKFKYGLGQKSELFKSHLLVKSAYLEIQKKKEELKNSQNELALLWGGGSEDIGELLPLPSLKLENSNIQKLNERLNSCLIYKEAELKSISYKDKLNLEKANASQDFKVSLGFRRLQDTQKETYLGEITIPLPIFNRNQGNINTAKAEESSGNLEFIQKKSELAMSVDKLQRNIASLINEYKTLYEEMHGEAKNSFLEVQKAFKLGKASYFELLDAEKTLNEIKKQFIETGVSIRKAQIDLNTILLSSSDDLGSEKKLNKG